MTLKIGTQNPLLQTGRSYGAIYLEMDDIQAPSQGVWGSPPARGLGVVLWLRAQGDQ